MDIKKISVLALTLVSSVIFAQDSIVATTIRKTPLTSRQVLDSIKATFVHDHIASCIDSLWMKELASLDLYDELTLDIKNINVDQEVDYELPTDLLKERLKRLDEKSAFNIEYNVGLENVIKSFLKNRKKSIERLMGVSQFYFPMFEEAMASKNIPLEIKYLAVVESALNPRAVSKMGATGLWQFMYQTGKQYNLDINTYVDERSDPLKASQAAAQYMENMYKIFGDWDLVLASYNSGPGNVAKAIRRSGGKQNYWNIRKHLPQETQGYVPAFLATMYIFEYHKEHGIKPNRAVANHFATDTIMIKNAMTFKQISELLDVPVAELQFLNPSYKRDEIPYITGENHYLRLPVSKVAVFTSNEDKIYAYVKSEANRRERPYETMLASKDSIVNYNSVSKVKYHKVRKGDSLSEISDKYGVTMTELRKWNHLKSNKAPLGRSLKIYSNESIASNDKKSIKQDTTAVKSSALASNTAKVFKEEKVVSYKDVVKHHKVKSGDNLGEISDKYGVSVTDLKKWNHLKNNNISSGTNLKIVKNERIVTVVRKEVKSETKVALNDSNAATPNGPDNFYEVQKGDNLFTIAKKFNVSLEDLKKWNNLEDSNVALGSKLALEKKNDEPNPETKTEVVVNETKTTKKESLASNNRDEVKLYYVKKGDSLFSIAKKYPGVTISDIKKWNGIKNESLKPGMKLKING